MRELENILKSLSALKDRIFHMLHQKRRSRVRRAFATVLACVVVFVTTYGMILPAITLDDDVAEDMPGVFFEEMPDPDTFTPDESEEEFYFEEGWDADAEPAPEDEGVQDEEIYFEEGWDLVPLEEDLAEEDGLGELTDTLSEEELAEDTGLEELTYTLSEALDGVTLHLDFAEGVAGSACLTFDEILDYYDNYYYGAEYELNRLYPEMAHTRTISSARFFRVDLKGSEGDILTGADFAAVRLEFVPALYDSTEMPAEQLIVVAWEDGAWQILNEDQVGVRWDEFGGICGAEFETEALRDGHAEWGVVVMGGIYEEEILEEEVIQEEIEDTFAEDLPAEEPVAETLEEVADKNEIVAESVLEEVEIVAEPEAESIVEIVEEVAESEAESVVEGIEEVVESTVESVAEEIEEVAESEAESIVEEVEEAVESTVESSAESVFEEVESTAEEVADPSETAESMVEEIAEPDFPAESVVEDMSQPESCAESVVEDIAEVYETAAENVMPEGVADTRRVDVPGEKYVLRVSYGADAGIPATAQIVAVPVDSEEYAAQALDLVNNEIDENNHADRLNVIGLFDLTAYWEGNVIAPTGEIRVSVEFPENIPANEQIFAVHFPGTGEQPEAFAGESTADLEIYAETYGTDVSDDGGSILPDEMILPEMLPKKSIKKAPQVQLAPSAGLKKMELPVAEMQVQPASQAEECARKEPEVVEAEVGKAVAEFAVNGFSYIAIVSYTVDFYFGEFEWHIAGGSEILLSELFGVLGIERSAADAVAVEFTDYELLAVEEVTDEESGQRVDWRLTSLRAFDTEEMLTVRMGDGAVIEVRVEDAQNEQRANITEYYFASNNSEYGYVVLTDSSGNINQSDTNAGRSGLNNAGTTSNRWAIPVANGGFRFVNWTNEGSQYTRYSPRGGNWDYGAYAIRPNKTQNDHTTNMFVANFEPIPVAYSFTYVTEGSGTVDKAAGMSTDAVGATATPEAGNHFVGWRIGTDIVSTVRTFDPSLVTTDGTVVTAVFAEGEETGINSFTYTVNDPSAGVIKLVNSSGSPSGSNNTGLTVTDTLNLAGTDAARYAMPVANSGYRFVNWTNEGSVYTSRRGNDENTIRPSVSEYENGQYTSGNFVANFVRENDFLVTIVAGEGGYTTVGSDPERHTIRYSELLAGDIGIIAWANEGYRSLGWVDEDGNVIGGLHAGDRRLYSDAVPTGRDCVVTAIFEEITDFNIYYRTNGTLGTVSATHEIVHKGQEPIGSVASPKEGYQFIGWVDQNGVTVGWFPEFKPYGDLIHEAATYTAVFESAAYSKILRVQAETDNGNPLGYVISPDYETSVNGHIVAMNVTDFDTTPASMIAVAYEDWVFDHWELNGNTLKDYENPDKDLGATIPKGYDLSSYGVMDGNYNVLIAYFKVDEDPTVHKIIYKSEAGGTVTGLGGRTDENGDYYDTWIGSHSAGNIYGARVVADSGYEFKGWKTEVKDANGNGTGQYMFPSYQATFVPEGDLITDAIYIATYIPSKNLVGYNLNVVDVPVTWTGPGSESDGLVVAAGNQDAVAEGFSPMYYPNHYYGHLEHFSLSEAIPEAEGYYFIGWYNKNRPDSSGREYIYQWPNGWGNYGSYVSHPKTNGNIIARGSRVDDEGHDMNNIYFPYSSGKNRYTFEAFYVHIDGYSKRLPYDGQFHQLVAEAELFEGSVEGTQRFREQLERMKSEGKYALGAVKYQLIDDEGNPIGDPTDSFERLDPGFYRVLAYADGHFDTHSFRISKEITLEIYPAKLIIRKYWRNDEGMNIRPDELEVTKKRYNPNKQGYANPDNSAVREVMEKDTRNQIESTAGLYGDRTKTEEELTHIQNGDPAWQVDNRVWTREYNNIQVRDPEYLESEQDSGWYVHFAEETVPEGYRLVNQTWERSADRLTTTITFVNEPLTQKVTLEKRNNNGELLQNAEFTLDMIKNFKDETLDPAVSMELKLGTTSADLVYGLYRLKEDKAPEDYLVLDTQIYFLVDMEGIHLTDKNGQILRDDEQNEIGSTEDVSLQDFTITVINGHTTIKLKKVDSVNKEQLLSGAIFQLLDQDKRVIEKTIGNLGNVTLKDGTTVNNAFTTDDKAPFEIRDLPNGSYVLREVQAPENYSIMEKDLSFKVKNGKAFDAAGNEVEELTYTVENASGVSLPETGGPGPNLLYLFGLMLLGLAGTGLMTKRRRGDAA